MPEDTTILARTEEQLLAVAERGLDQCPALRRDLADYRQQDLPPALRRVLEENMELLIADPKAVAEHEEAAELVLELAAMGVDCLPLRDALASVCRRRHRDWADPAGLIRALGVLDTAVPTPAVCQRWAAFDLLAEGRPCYHPGFGIGKIAEIDPFTDQVYVDYERRTGMSLEQMLCGNHLPRPDSIAERLLAGDGKVNPTDQDPRDFAAELAAAFVPPLPDGVAAARTLLVPRHLGERAYRTWRETGSKPRPGADGDSPQRRWYQARSLQELKLLLREENQVELDEERAAAVRQVFAHAAHNPRSGPGFAEALAEFCQRVADVTTVDAILADLEPALWRDAEHFVAASVKLPARLVLPWLQATERAVTPDHFLHLVAALPLEHWPYIETVLETDGERLEAFQEYVHERCRRGRGSADMAVWLWRRIAGTHAPYLSVAVVFRILGKECHGKFLKARRELKNLMLGDAEFVAVMTDNGRAGGINNFAKTARNLAVLEPGELQSLLVKLVRLYPAAREIVEERREVPELKAAPKVSSYRSLEALRVELQDIINKRIPQNSADIARARSYGDLRENAEYKAAKENQRLLMARRAELEGILIETQASDFSEVQVSDRVVPGCTVTIADDQERRQFYLLGVWDSVPERSIMSCDAPLGRLLLGQQVGDTLITPDEREVRIESIAPLPAEILAWAHAPESP